MYTLGQLRRGLTRGLENPAYFARECNRQYYRRFGRREHNPDGVDVMAADWDVLVILDACRYDVFAARHDLPGKLERRQSRGSHTSEFLEANFSDGEYTDTVYLSASPQLYRKRDRLDASFHAVSHVWRESGWDDEYGTVLPETMTDRAVEAAERYPNKRLIVHYLQPHYPFIGASDINTRSFGGNDEELDIWNKLMRGELGVSADRVWKAYEQNLDRALDALEPLLAGVEGRFVVTSDHGNLFGSRVGPVPIREWGHPPGVYARELVEVPWLVYERGQRRRIVTGQGQPEQGVDEIEAETVESRLQNLGYV
jgi:hypothetical protein